MEHCQKGKCGTQCSRENLQPQRGRFKPIMKNLAVNKNLVLITQQLPSHWLWSKAHRVPKLTQKNNDEDSPTFNTLLRQSKPPHDSIKLLTHSFYTSSLWLMKACVQMNGHVTTNLAAMISQLDHSIAKTNQMRF